MQTPHYLRQHPTFPLVRDLATFITSFVHENMNKGWLESPSKREFGFHCLQHGEDHRQNRRTPRECDVLLPRVLPSENSNGTYLLGIYPVSGLERVVESQG
jgi:hypothetical protein